MAQLTEGGNVFPDVGPIKKEYVPGVIKKLKAILPPSLNFVPHIGSAGFKVESGDMDIFIDAAEVSSTFNTPDEKTAKVALKRYLEGKGYQCALSGRNVHVRMPTGAGTFVQVDLMIIPDAARVAPFHQHGDFANNLPGQYADPDFKGGQLFVMYSSLAKALGLKFSPFEGKLVDRATNELVADNKDAVAKILLNPTATAADLASVKTIMRALQNDPKKDLKLAQARADAQKGLIKLPESVQHGSPLWFRQISNLVAEPELTETLDHSDDEFEILDEAFVIKGNIGKGMTYGIGDHFMKRLAERNVPWKYAERIIKRFPYIKPKLMQMLHFPKFYLRDDETDVELGCKFTSFGAPDVCLLYVNTVVVHRGVRNSDTPTIIVNAQVNK